MNLKSYYAKVRETEASLDGPDVLVISLATPDGGKPGVKTVTSRRVAAQLIVEGKARVASEEERAMWEEEESARREEAKRDELAQRIQVQLVSDPELSRKR